MLFEVFKEDYSLSKDIQIWSKMMLETSPVFQFPYGVCHRVSNLDMTKIFEITLPGSHPNLDIFITDPRKQTYTTIDLGSLTGDSLECKREHLCTFEIDIVIRDLRNPGASDACSDTVPYTKCVNEQIDFFYLEVRQDLYTLMTIYQEKDNQ